MRLKPIPRHGTTSTRKKFWDDVRDEVLSLRKIAGKNAAVSEHEDKGTVVDILRSRPAEIIGNICCDGYICRVIPFSPDCQDLCGTFILDAPCSECENIWCPPNATAFVQADVLGLTECGCVGSGGVSHIYNFSLDGTYNLPRSGSPCVWELSLPAAVTRYDYLHNETCSGDPDQVLHYDLLFRFSCNSLYPETGVHIFGRIYCGSIFDLFSNGQDFVHVNPWLLTNTISCGTGTPIGIAAGGTITFSWS